MVLQLNDLVGFKDNYWLKQTFSDMKRITSDTYPEQNMEVLGKRVHIDCIDYEGGHRLIDRLNITKNHYPEYEGRESEDLPQWWKIVRFDKDYQFTLDQLDQNEIEDDIIKTGDGEYSVKDNIVTIPGKAILIGAKNKVIVTSTEKISRMWYYPEYIMEDNELYLPRAWNWKKFNKERKLDFVHPLPVQNRTYLGMPVMTEYYHDILKYDSIVNRMPESPDQHITFEQIKEHLYLSDPELQKAKVPDVILKSFPLYYSRHEHHNLDIPRRAINYGVLIRVDEQHILGGDGIVVAEIREDKSIRYVTGSEAFVYFDTDSKKVDLTEILGKQKLL